MNREISSLSVRQALENLKGQSQLAVAKQISLYDSSKTTASWRKVLEKIKKFTRDRSRSKLRYNDRDWTAFLDSAVTTPVYPAKQKIPAAARRRVPRGEV